MAGLLVVLAFAGATTTLDLPVLTDDRLMTVAEGLFRSKGASRSSLVADEMVLGLYHGVPVVADGACIGCHPASAEVIHFKLEPGPACRRADGMKLKYRLNTSGWRNEADADGKPPADKWFCVPALLWKKDLDHPLPWKSKPTSPDDGVSVTEYR